VKKKLSVFFFEGLLLNYPEGNLREEWLKDPECLYYPNVSDIPGPDAWDQFACSFFRREINELKSDVILMTGIEAQENRIESRIKQLIKFLGVEIDTVIRKDPGEETFKFCMSKLGYHLSCMKDTKASYNEINLYLNDLELAKDIADYIITEFSITTIVHDLYSS
tara:strand:- start:454 stop:948 length:495 start_codon:yes stop_codon:yes gene_type:complete